MSGEYDQYDENTLGLIKALESISRILDNLNYECCSREYTLDEDEMGWVFYCRDLAFEALRKQGERHVRR